MQEKLFGFGDGNKPFAIANTSENIGQSDHSIEEPVNKLKNDSTISKDKPNTVSVVSSDAGKEIEKQGSKRKPESHLISLVKKKKVQKSQNFTMETIFDRFPTVNDDIFEYLDEKSLANCVKVNRRWQTTIANQKVYIKKKIQKWSKHCKKSNQMKWLKSENLMKILLKHKFAISFLILS